LQNSRAHSRHVAVVGAPHQLWGETVVAFVSVTEGASSRSTRCADTPRPNSWQTMTEAQPEQGNAIMLGKRLESSNEGTGQLTSKPS
jgi:hypothetical protein